MFFIYFISICPNIFDFQQSEPMDRAFIGYENKFVLPGKRLLNIGEIEIKTSFRIPYFNFDIHSSSPFNKP